MERLSIVAGRKNGGVFGDLNLACDSAIHDLVWRAGQNLAKALLRNNGGVSVPGESMKFPAHLYPACAPLPAPMADHLLLLERRRYRHRPAQRPDDQEMARIVLTRIKRARTLVFEYLHPFVLADQKRQERGESRTFPNADWLLETLAQYTPGQGGNAEATLDFWQKKGLLRREKTRGLLDITSVAALLVARITERTLQRNWLPSSLEETEPSWWCYGRVSPGMPIQALPVPLPSDLPSSMVLWTAWQGAIWDGTWRTVGEAFLCRWAGSPSLHDLSLWQQDLPRKIQAVQHDSFFGRPPVQAVLLQEARSDVLLDIAQKGIGCYAESDW